MEFEKAIQKFKEHIQYYAQEILTKSKCKIEDKKQKQRLPEKLQRILGHYKSIGWIADYNLTDSQIEIKLPKKK